MKRWLTAALLAASTLLVGCATTTTVRSNVTTFHEWPDTLPDKSYVFERTQEQNNNLEYRNYEDLVRVELNRLGFSEALEGRKPALKATLSYSLGVRDVREVYPVAVSPGPYWGPYWGSPYWRGYYDPFYDPFWAWPPVYEQREVSYQLYTRRLRVTLARLPGNKQLYETTVVSEGQNPSLAAVMPYMVRSAFAEFPGKSGVSRVVELQMKE